MPELNPAASPSFTIRAARLDDAPVIARFNQNLAMETEELKLDDAKVLAGVQRLISVPERGRYFVAEVAGKIVGQVMHTREWSDWRNGEFWWVQSVYVAKSARGMGLFKALYRHLEELARNTPDVVGLRLYVEQANETAQAVYHRLGLGMTHYMVMESEFGSSPASAE